MSAHESFSWGADTLGRQSTRPRRGAARVSGRSSLLRARANAVIIDGLILLVPTLAVAWLLSLAFPHHGFFLARTASQGRARLGFGPPGWLLITALSLSYFFVLESVRGQTIGKRRMGLRVRTVAGGHPGPNAISARTVLRLIDVLPALYLLGALVARLSGSRRRRIGDWLAGTVVEHDDGTAADPPAQVSWRIVVYPVLWIGAVLLAVFAFGLGDAVGQGERGIALVQSYVRARQQGDAALACSMLTTEQQRELVALQSGNVRSATAGRCPAYILRTDPDSHLLNPGLAAFAGAQLASETTSLGAVVVRAPEQALALVAVPQDGRLKLDMRGVQRLAFLSECAGAGQLTPSQCSCTFNLLRAQEALPQGPPTIATIEAIRRDAARCRLEGPVATG
jgi:uncharacterized RDD family membrane protein YckC